MSHPVICGIYKITSPSKRVYIGQSVDIYKRWRLYKKYKCILQPLLYNSLKKHGVEKHIFEILCQCYRIELNKLEKYYVDLFQTFNSEYGLNLKDGGGNSVSFSMESRLKISKKVSGDKNGMFGVTHTDEYKKEMSEKLKGRTILWGEKISKKLKGKPLSAKNKENLSKSHIGKKHTEKTKEKISIARFGRQHTQESCEKMSKIILNIETGIFYIGTKNAAFSACLNPSTLGCRLSGYGTNNTSFIRV